MGGIVRTIFGGPEYKKERSTSSSSSFNRAYDTLAPALGPSLGFLPQGGNAMAALLGLGPTPTYSPTPSTGGGFPSTGGSRTPLVPSRQSTIGTGMVRPALQNGGEEGLLSRFYAQSSGNPYLRTASGGPNAGTQKSALENFADSAGMKFLMEQGIRGVEGSMAGRGMLGSGATLKALTKMGHGLGSTYLNQYMDHLLNYAKLGQGAGAILASAGNVSSSVGESSGKAQGEKQGILPMVAAAVAGGA